MTAIQANHDDTFKIAREKNIPVTAHILVTHRCNERCLHCYLPASREADELTLAEIDDLLRQLRKAGTIYVVITGGEPTLRSDFLDILALVRKHNLALSIYTNGVRIDMETAKKIAALYPFEAVLSLYSHNPEVHEAITRLPGSFEKTVAAIKNFIALGVKVRIKSASMKQNQNDYAAVREFAKGLGAEVAAPSAYLFPPKMNFNKIEDIFCDDDKILELQNRPETDGRQPTSEEAEEGKLCGAGSSTVSIAPEGSVFPCSLFTEPVGNIREQSFKEIWQNSEFLLRLRALRRSDLKECLKCPVFSRCGRCTASAFLGTKNLTGIDTTACKLYKL